MKPLLLMTDIETVPVDGALAFIEPIKIPANYTNPDTIEAYRQKKIAECSLDPDLCRMVALGFRLQGETETRAFIATTEDEERELLQRYWAFFGAAHDRSKTGVAMAGLNLNEFDFPILMRRSHYLGVKTPKFRTGRYAYQRPQVVDLYDTLTMDYNRCFGHPRPKEWYVRRWGLNVPEDPHTGADVGRLVQEGNWDAVLHHVKTDVDVEVAMAQWLGLWPTN